MWRAGGRSKTFLEGCKNGWKCRSNYKGTRRVGNVCWISGPTSHCKRAHVAGIGIVDWQVFMVGLYGIRLVRILCEAIPAVMVSPGVAMAITSQRDASCR